MVKIGITGGIGSGKTTICKIFEILGIPVFYADDVAKDIMTQDPLLVEDIKKNFGALSYHDSGELNRKHIAGIVFNNDKELAKLNSLVHPAVFRAFDQWDANISTAVPYNMKEAALLFESGSYKKCDLTILVTAPINIRIARVMQRDGISEAQVRARMDKQLADEEKIKMADFFIVNDENQSVINQVLHVHQQILAFKKNQV